jgi:HAD superfamily hydrolase (TIGR01484 family)
MIKMVVTDIDGTIFSEKGLSEKVRGCLQNLCKKGIHVAIATGRTFGSAKYIAKEIGIECPLICYQGGLVNSFEGEILDVKYLDATIAKK